MKGHVFEHGRDLEARLAAALNVAVFLDFDGTLTPLNST